MNRVMGLVAALALVLAAAPAAQATNPGSNGRIAYLTEQGAGISTIKPDGTGEETLSRSGTVADVVTITAPVAWSPDGRQIAAADVHGGFGETGWVLVANSDGTGSRYVSPQINTIDERGPTWSPDGRTIAFESHNFGTFLDDIGTRTTATGGNLRILTRNVQAPVWSPDGTRFVFGRNDGPIACSDVWTSDSRGRALVQLTRTAADETTPDWSPDNRQIVFASSAGETSCNDHHIAVMNADGTNVRQLTTSLPGTGLRGEDWPKFSPDGRQIVYQRNRGPLGTELWIMNADGTGDHKLIDGLGPSWQPIPAGAATPPSPGPPVLASTSVSETPVGGGGVGPGTVTLDRAAPTGGTVVQLSSADPAVASVPATVTVPEHQDHVDYTISGGHPANDTPVVITATLGSVSRQATVTVEGIPQLSSVTVPASVGGGLSALGFASFTKQVSDGPVALTSSDPAVASVPATVIANGNGVSFIVHTQQVTTSRAVTITASYAGKTASANIIVAAGDPFTSLTLADGAARGVCPGGAVDSEQATVRLASTSAEGVTVSLSSSDPIVAVPASVVVGDPAFTTFFATVTDTVAAPRTATITATALGITKTVQLSVVPCVSVTQPPPSAFDTVTISRATYDSAKRELRVSATSSGRGATLTVFNDATGDQIGQLQNGSGRFRNVANPGTVRVTSSLGGSATRAVAAASGTVHAAPSTPAAATVTGAPSAKAAPASRLRETAQITLPKADPRDHAAPAIAALRALPRRLRAGHTTLVSFTLSEAARTTLSFQRLRHRRFVAVPGTIVRTLPSGRVRIRVPARRSGTYRVIVSAVDASGNRAAARRIVVIVRRAIS